MNWLVLCSVEYSRSQAETARQEAARAAAAAEAKAQALKRQEAEAAALRQQIQAAEARRGEDQTTRKKVRNRFLVSLETVEPRRSESRRSCFFVVVAIVFKL